MNCSGSGVVLPDGVAFTQSVWARDVTRTGKGRFLIAILVMLSFSVQAILLFVGTDSWGSCFSWREQVIGHRPS